MNTMTYLTGVVTLELEREKCNGCGNCVQVCPFGAIHAEGTS